MHIEADLFGSDDGIANANKNSTAVQGSVLPKYIVRTWKYRVSGYCGIQFRFAPQDDVRLVQIDECLEFSFFSWALYAITILACEQVLLFGLVKRVLRERASERRSREVSPTLTRSREARFACPNRRACSQAITIQ